ncbi:membrane protein [Nocardioides baekrokdamisoli]|uniref:Membrane protein n=1 Tax=Nocardioides baekrokdamisoli TaxID=1804624 RepID=A0A3G9ICU1_9ACTN|nr:EamA family transporter [Nocardioides baekrokdamisoli]BBH16767.1 membrane protein [Nocardioides baekrokdamisoli]
MSRVPAWVLTVAAIFTAQAGSVFSVRLIPLVGSDGTAWLRFTIAGLILLALVRPPLRSMSRRELPALIGLGLATAVMTTCFINALAHLPLGTVVAIEFLGPLSVAAFQAADRRTLIWPATAFAGVLLLTRPWLGSVSAAGIAFAVGAAAGWGAYIVLTQKVGDQFSGISALAITIPVAALATAPLGAAPAGSHLSWHVVVLAGAMAALSPVVTFGLEMVSLRRMSQTAFGTLMALEPAVASLLGFAWLGQSISLWQLAGTALVVAAGAATQRTGQRALVLET